VIHYHAFAAVYDTSQAIELNEHIIFATNTDTGPHLIPDDNDEDSMHETTDSNMDTHIICSSEQDLPKQSLPQTREENLTNFSQIKIPALTNVIEDDKDRVVATSPQAKLLHWHYHLGHHSFARIHLLAFLGILLRQLTTIKPPKCAGCLYGSMTKCPWHTKLTHN
jgi:hypothetical protein